MRAFDAGCGEMKPKPAVVAALMLVAALVSVEFAAVTNHAARAGASWCVRVRATAAADATLGAVKLATRVIVCWAKS
jgi:hypothetical protein